MEEQSKAVFKRIFARLKPPPEMRLSDWADRYRRIPQGAAEPGRWRTDRAPHMREVMDSISDVRIKKVVVMSSAQVAKSETLVNVVGYYMHYDPVPILMMQPTITMAESFSKNRLAKSIQETPVLRGMISDRRGAGNTILEKVFPGGSIAIVGANSPSSLASRPVQVLLADEVDRYPATAGTEGDPLFLASERLTTFWNSKEVYVSTPGNKGTSRIELEYQNSSQGEWNVPCPHCGELQPLTWEGVVFDKDNLDTIQYCCSKCAALATEAEWKKGFINGKYIHAEPENPVRGFHLNALGSTLARWRDIVEKFLLANEEKKKGNIEELKSWTNTKMGQTWEEEGTEIDESALMKRRERYNCEVPPEVLYLTAGVDTQDDRFEAEVVGWGVDYESWGIKYAAIYGDLKLDQVWKDLDAFLSQTFTKPDGTKLKIICACMDTGGHFTNQVYRFCKARYARGLRAIKGSNDSQSAYIQKPTKGNREGVNLFMLGVDTGKSLLLQRLLLEDEGPGYCHFPKEEGRGYDESFFIGLTAEKQVLTYKKGRPVFEWKIKDYKHKGRRHYAEKSKKQAARAPRGESIEKRPKEIGKREKFGHWEMDSVMGCKRSKQALLVLTERRTRMGIMILVEDHTAASVVKAINRLERKFGKLFYTLFKSITVDNGSEFQDFEGIEIAHRRKGKRTIVFFCHPYSAYERGSNENMNRLIRRFFPKGTNFDEVTKEQVAEAERWINNYPRKLLGWKSAADLFDEERQAA